MPGRQTKDYCFTYNNYSEDDVDRISRLVGDDEVGYIIFGREVGEMGTRHLQGFIQFKRKKTMQGAKNAIGSNSVHLEERRGTVDEAIEYCKKENQWVEFGEVERSRGSGYRSDLAGVEAAVREGACAADIASKYFGIYVRYYRGIEAALSYRVQPRDFRTQAIWFWGRSGTGKSREAFRESMALCDGSVCYAGDPSLRWFDPYRGEKGFVVDDFDGTAHIPVLLRLLDRYPHRVPIKGGFVEFRCRIVWITSNASPSELYGRHHQFDALMRRFDEVKEFV